MIKHLIGFAVLAALCAPAFAGYSSAATVTFPAASGSTTDTNITLAFTGSDAKLATLANGGLVQHTVSRVGVTVPADLVLTNDSTCATITGSYTWGIEAYSATAGTIVGWVLIPSLTTGAAVAPTVCVGNAAVTTYQGGAQGAEFDTNALAVYHMNETSGQHNDWTANAFNSTAVSAAIEGSATGKIDGADSYTAAGNRTTLPFASLALGTSAYTMSGWANSSNWAAAVTLMRISGAFNEQVLVVNGGGVVRADSNNGITVGTTVLTNSTWYYIACVYAGGGTSGAMKVYVNGVLDGTGAGAGQSNGAPTAASTGGDPFNAVMSGPFDESRLATIARSADWLLTEYANQNAPPAIGAFTTLATSAPRLLLLGVGD